MMIEFKNPELTRRKFLGTSVGAGAAMVLNPALQAFAQTGTGLITRPVPKTGELLPAIGLGSSATFSRVAGREDFDSVSAVLSKLHEMGGAIFDTAPSYGASEEVAGQVTQELGINKDLFWATKLNVVPRGGSSADPAEARAQLEASFKYAGRDLIDLIQVHNLADMATQMPLLHELKEQGRVRYVGATTTREGTYDDIANYMESDNLDFIGIDYAVDNLTVEERVLPVAADRGVAVLVYAPFGRTRLWSRVSGVTLPDYAAEFDAHSWGQFFLKFVLSHPVVTAATPATSNPDNMADNAGAMVGRLPDADLRRRMIATIDALPM